MIWDQVFVYDATSPSHLRWKHDRFTGKGRKHISAGDVAGYEMVNGYWQVELYYEPYLCHRIIAEMFGLGPLDGKQVDHIDGCRYNNAPSNLRVVSRAINARNTKKRVDNTSGVVGVCLHSTRKYTYWTASVGKTLKKAFPVHRLGNDEAFRLACEWRADMIEQLNAQGAGYTERHGKE